MGKPRARGRSKLGRWLYEDGAVSAEDAGSPAFPYGPFRPEPWGSMNTSKWIVFGLVVAILVGVGAWGALDIPQAWNDRLLLAFGIVTFAVGIPYILLLATPVREFRVGPAGVEVRFRGPVRGAPWFVLWQSVTLTEQTGLIPPVNERSIPTFESPMARLVMSFRDPGLPLPRWVFVLVPPEGSRLVAAVAEMASKTLGPTKGPWLVLGPNPPVD
jgi:hypothetical protein